MGMRNWYRSITTGDGETVETAVLSPMTGRAVVLSMIIGGFTSSNSCTVYITHNDNTVFASWTISGSNFSYSGEFSKRYNNIIYLKTGQKIRIMTDDSNISFFASGWEER